MTDLREMGICDFWGEPHAFNAGAPNCRNWRPVKPIEFDKTVEVVNQKNSFGVWIDGIFRPVDLGALVKIFQVKDAAMDELKRENLRLQSEVQKLIFQVDNEREIGKQIGRCLKDEQEKTMNAQMFGVSCVCKWQSGKVVSLCGAHQMATNEIAEKFRKLTESL
jgi:hypothetical protein